MIALLVNGLYARRLTPLNKVAKWHWMFVIWALASILWALNSDVSMQRVFTVVSLLSLYTVVSMYGFRQNEYEFIKKAIMYGGVAAAIYTIYSHLFLGTFYTGNKSEMRASLMFGNMASDPNYLMFYLLIPFAICVYGAITSKGFWKKFYYSLMVLAMVYTGTITASRGGLLSMIAIVLVIAYYSSRKQKVLIGIIAAIVTFLALSVASEMLFMRFDRIANGSGRLGIWEVGLTAFKHNLMGVGLDNFPVAYGYYLNDVPSAGVGLGEHMVAHNIYMETLVNFGPIGLVILLIILLGNFKLLKSSVRKLGDAELLKAAFMGMLLQAFTLGVLWKKQFWLIFFLISIYHNIAEKKNVEPYSVV